MKRISDSLNKKLTYAVCLTALIAISVFFTSCGSEWGAHGGQYSGEAEQKGSSFKDAITRTIDIADIDPEKSRLIYDFQNSIYDGLFDSAQPFDTNTYYFTMNKDNNTKYGINLSAKIDENAKQIVLCNKPECSHEDESCSAYISMTGGYFTVNGKLYFYSPCSYELSDDPFNGEGDRIRLLAIDENGKKLVAEIEGYTQDSGSVITDGDAIYFTAQRWNSTETCVMKINVHTGDSMILYRFPANIGLTNYRISDITDDGKQIIFTARDSRQMDNYVVGVYSVPDGRYAVTHILEYEDFMDREKGRNISDCTIVGNYIYIIDGATGQMTRQRIGSQNIEVLFENIKDVIGDTDCVLMSYTYNNKMVLTRTGKNGSYLGTSKDFVLDTATLEITPLDFRGRDSMNTVHLVRLFSATPDYFIIATNTTGYNALANEMVLISKADFYTNNIKTMPLGVMVFY